MAKKFNFKKDAEKKSVKKQSDKKKWALPLGIVIVVFALIGVVSVIALSIGGITKLADNSEKFTEYEKFLSPVVMNDPDPFDDVSKADMSQLLDATIWALMNSNIEPDKYEYAEGDVSGLIVPQKDVEKHFEKLFGSEVKPLHTTIEGGTYTFTYDETRKAYIVPLTGVVPIYIPRVIAQDKKGDSTILTVGYISGDSWDQDERGNYISPEPNKYMKITLRDNGKKGYYISAMQNTETPEIAEAETKKPKKTKPEETTAIIQESDTQLQTQAAEQDSTAA